MRGFSFSTGVLAACTRGQAIHPCILLILKGLSKLVPEIGIGTKSAFGH